jgi:hypothetical protein
MCVHIARTDTQAYRETHIDTHLGSTSNGNYLAIRCDFSDAVIDLHTRPYMSGRHTRLTCATYM